MSRQLTLPTVARVEYAWPAEASRPKHRLREAGPDALSDAELIAVVLGMDDAEGVCRVAGLLEQTRGLAGLRSYSLQLLARQLGTDLGAGKLGAVLELARRVFRGSGGEPPTIRCPQDAAVLLIPEIGHLEQEPFQLVIQASYLFFQPFYHGTQLTPFFDSYLIRFPSLGSLLSLVSQALQLKELLTELLVEL